MPIMSDYYRSWKSGAGHKSPSLHIPIRKTGSKKRSLLWRLIFGFFRMMARIFRFFFGRRSLVKKLLAAGAASGLLAFIFFGLLFVYYSLTLPDPNKLSERVVPESTKIFDREGKLLYEIHGEAKRTLVPLSEIPDFAERAVIAIEDKDFYRHSGFSLTGIVRSALKNLLTGSKVGGSTITQQFVRNAVLTREKTYTRKFKELVISLQLERKYSKNEILQLYLNEIPYGSNAYGIEAASQTFFGKSAKDLNLKEAAYLAALPQAPTYYSPYGPNKDELDARANTVLKLMAEQGHITAEQKQAAQNQKVEFRKIGRGILAPHFVLYVQDLLAQKYGEISLQEGGLKVTTTLDLKLQTIAEEIIAKSLEQNEKKYNVGNSALVAIDPRSGQILAMIGSRDYFDEAHDGAVNVALRPRQPGSSFKPYVYATAFQKGMNPATMLMDVVTNFGEFGGKEYTPQNYDGKEHGPVSVRQALQGSLNIPAVKTLILTGIEDSIQTAENLGITTLKERSRFGPALVLGGAEVKLLEHTAAYSAFAVNGTKYPTTAILKVEDKNGNVLEEFRPSSGKEVLNPQVAYLITNILSDNEARVFIFGRNNRLYLPDRPAAAKTGTTQEYRDAWTIGYVPSLVVGVWAGNNDNSSMTGGASGALIPAAIWNEFMRRALEGQPSEEFQRPEGIIEKEVDILSGKLPTALTPATKTEIFTSFNTPAESDDVHLPGEIVLHSERPHDPAWEEPVRSWTERNGYGYLPPGENQFTLDAQININLTVPQKITESSWVIKAEAKGPDPVTAMEIYLDNELLSESNSDKISFTDKKKRANGRHQITAIAKTAKNTKNRKTAEVELAQGEALVLLSPEDNQEISLPVTIILEANQNIAPENARFFAKTAAGKLISLGGEVTKQSFGEIFRYHLSLTSSPGLEGGSYALFAQINALKSPEVIVKIK